MVKSTRDAQKEEKIMEKLNIINDGETIDTKNTMYNYIKAPTKATTVIIIIMIYTLLWFASAALNHLVQFLPVSKIIGLFAYCIITYFIFLRAKKSSVDEIHRNSQLNTVIYTNFLIFSSDLIISYWLLQIAWAN